MRTYFELLGTGDLFSVSTMWKAIRGQIFGSGVVSKTHCSKTFCWPILQQLTFFKKTNGKAM